VRSNRSEETLIFQHNERLSDSRGAVAKQILTKMPQI